MSTPAERRHPVRSQSRFLGTELAELFGVSALGGAFEDDAWQLLGHPDLHASFVTDVLHWESTPAALVEVLKELVVLAVRPDLHGDVTTSLLAVKPKNVLTVYRWLSHLVIDLSWLRARAGSLSDVTQDDLDTWRTNDDLDVDHRRVSAVMAFARYGQAMTPSLDRLSIEPWPGRSGLDVGGGLRSDPANRTLPLPMAILGPWLEGGMFLVQHYDPILLAVHNTLTGQPVEKGRASWLPRQMTTWQAREWARAVAAASAFVTVAFSGMRASEFETIPRENALTAIEVAGTRRWLLAGHLVKGMKHPKPEMWIVPPVVAEAVQAMLAVLVVLEVGDDREYGLIGTAPLYDHRATVVLARRGKGSKKTTMNFGLVATYLEPVLCGLAASGHVPGVPAKKPTGRELRRTFARIVASRPGGPQAAMDQFKWQSPATASGYFRIAPDAVALSQRELYEDVRKLQREMVLDVAVREYDLWARAVDDGQAPLFPAGPDGRRKRDAFAAVRDTAEHNPRVVEDPRRLRALLEPHVERVYLTEFGFCDFNPDFALCDLGAGPDPARCRPNECMNSSVLKLTIEAHQVKRDRLVELAQDKSLPPMIRQKVRAEVQIIERDLGPALEVPRD